MAKRAKTILPIDSKVNNRVRLASKPLLFAWVMLAPISIVDPSYDILRWWKHSRRAVRSVYNRHAVSCDRAAGRVTNLLCAPAGLKQHCGDLDGSGGRGGRHGGLRRFRAFPRDVGGGFEGPALTVSPDGQWVLYLRADHFESAIQLVEDFH